MTDLESGVLQQTWISLYRGKLKVSSELLYHKLYLPPQGAFGGGGGSAVAACQTGTMRHRDWRAAATAAAASNDTQDAGKTGDAEETAKEVRLEIRTNFA